MTGALQEKEDKENEMREKWIADNLQNDSDSNLTEIPDFEYYDLENHIFCNYYLYMTSFSQGTALILAVACNFTREGFKR